MKKYEMFLELPDYKIVDFHLHLPIEQDDWLKPYRDRYLEINGQEKYDQLLELNQKTKPWLPIYSFPTPEKPSSDYLEVAKRWNEEIKKFNLEKIVFQTGGNNEILSEVTKINKEQIIGFAHHYIKEENADKTLLHAIKRLGLKGYKILAPVVDTPLNDRCFDKVWQVCHDHELPVLIHFGILGGANGIVSGVNMNPLIIGETTKRFPKIKFIIPHFGCGYPNELLSLCWSSPNVYVDTSGNNLWTNYMMESYTLEQLFKKFYETIGPERIIFGSDSEWFPRGFAIQYLLEQLRACRKLNIPEEHIKLIFRTNALKLLKMED